MIRTRVPRTHNHHKEWTVPEIRWLKENAPLFAFRKDMLPYLPNHTFAAIQKKCERLGLSGEWTKGQWHMAKYMTPLYLWWELQKAPGTVKDLTRRMNLSRPMVEDYLKLFHKAGVVHIHDWIRVPGAGQWVKVWAVGHNERNVRRPRPGGKRRHHVERLARYAGNPFAHLLESQHVDPKSAQDVRT